MNYSEEQLSLVEISRACTTSIIRPKLILACDLYRRFTSLHASIGIVVHQQAPVPEIWHDLYPLTFERDVKPLKDILNEPFSFSMMMQSFSMQLTSQSHGRIKSHTNASDQPLTGEVNLLQSQTNHLLSSLGTQYHTRRALMVSIPLQRQWQFHLIMLRQRGQALPHHYPIEQLNQFSEITRDLLNSAIHEHLNTSAGPSPEPALSTITRDDYLKKLSHAESHVLELLEKKMTEKSIAQELDRSPNTVHVHVKNIYRKLDVNSRSQLLQKISQTNNN